MAKKKLRFTSLLFKHRDKPSSWLWPSCTNCRTNSFRSPQTYDIYKTINSVYFTPVTTSDSWFTNTSELGCFFTESEESGVDSTETTIRGLRSERFFFEPGESRSILEAAKAGGGFLLEESVVLEMESEDPYLDFRVSMEEMVEARGLKDWERLQELFVWYLRMNRKETHGFIVGAFVDLLVGLLSTSSSLDICREENLSSFETCF